MKAILSNNSTVFSLMVAFATSFSVVADMQWPEGFEETNLNAWTIEGGVWEIGTLSGAHSGTGLAGTVIGGNYPNSVNARLISPEFVVPTAGEQPRLRFWSWHSTYEAADYGQLQIRTSGGAWENLTEQISRNTGAYWKPRLVDLSAYAGQTVQIAFRFVANSYGTSSGWYVDDLALETGPLAMDLLNNPEHFESGLGGLVCRRRRVANRF